MPFNPVPISIPRLPSAPFNPVRINLPRLPTSIFRPMRQSVTGNSAYNSKSHSNKDGWAQGKFYFEVDFGSNVNIGFQTCDGLETTIEAYEFRDGNATDFHKQKRPGQVAFSNVTLKKGMFAGDKDLYKWFKNVATGAIFGDMRTVKIRLLDESGGVVFTWTLNKAFVVRYAPTSMDANDGDEVAVEEIEIACQSWTLDSSGGGLLGMISGMIGGAINGAVSGALSAVGNLTGSISGSISGSIGF